MLRIIAPSDELIFFRGVETTNQQYVPLRLRYTDPIISYPYNMVGEYELHPHEMVGEDLRMFVSDLS